MCAADDLMSCVGGWLTPIISVSRILSTMKLFALRGFPPRKQTLTRSAVGVKSSPLHGGFSGSLRANKYMCTKLIGVGMSGQEINKFQAHIRWWTRRIQSTDHVVLFERADRDQTKPKRNKSHTVRGVYSSIGLSRCLRWSVRVRLST